MNDELTTSIITERWSGHAKFVISYDTLKKLYGADNTVLNALKPEMNSIWEMSNLKSYRPTYGFQKGSLLFTTTPPQCGINRLSEFCVGSSQTFPRTALKQHYNKNCGFQNEIDRKSQLTNATAEVCDNQPIGISLNLEDSTYQKNREALKKRWKSTCNITLTCDELRNEEDCRRNSDLHRELSKSNDVSRREQKIYGGSKSDLNNADNIVFSTHFSTNLLNKINSKVSSCTKTDKSGSEESDKTFLKTENLFTSDQENHRYKVEQRQLSW